MNWLCICGRKQVKENCIKRKRDDLEWEDGKKDDGKKDDGSRKEKARRKKKGVKGRSKRSTKHTKTSNSFKQDSKASLTTDSKPNIQYGVLNETREESGMSKEQRRKVFKKKIRKVMKKCSDQDVVNLSDPAISYNPKFNFKDIDIE
ncbi:unnamed protein product [Moneuplotes crassus]|uniref:Uncharacterized protein n=1 Tax=Euplotes crassus TaxID=5936 RepID=A0AAD2D4B2_EUPCR|nr:unnamed protein product [Moneuplotes crassus]